MKLRSHMRGAVAEQRWADFDIPAPLLRVCSHIRGADAERMLADLPFLEDNDGLERAVSKRTQQIGCWTHFLRSGFCSRSATGHVWTHVMICVEANFLPASARVRMCQRTFFWCMMQQKHSYLNSLRPSDAIWHWGSWSTLVKLD